MPKYIHQFLRAARLTSPSAKWHAQKGETLTKCYDRMPRITLPEPVDSGISLSDALSKRRSLDAKSVRTFGAPESAMILGGALRENKNGLRPYPSGGARYPVECYLVSTLNTLDTMWVFHYRPDIHVLEKLWPVSATELKNLHTSLRPNSPQAFIMLTCYFPRTTQKYGDFGYLHSILECGHVAQNILLMGTAEGFHLWPQTSFVDEDVSKMLDLDPEHEQTAYVITLS